MQRTIHMFREIEQRLNAAEDQRHC
jgi:hypothetical protein